MIDSLQHILPEERIREFRAIASERSIAASDYFIRAGETPSRIGFVEKGLFRYLYTNDNGVEFTKAILAENSFISSYSAMILGRPSFFSIEALENSEILEIRWADFLHLKEKEVFWVNFLLKFVEKGYITKEKRERDLLLLDAETRYRNFLTEFPGLDQRIKQGIIASYLGIQPETLSRIRRKITF